MSTRLLVAALAAALLGLPACGGGGDDSGTGPEPEAQPAETGSAPGDYFAQQQIDLAIEDESAFMVGTAVVSAADSGATHITIFLDQYPDTGAAVEFRKGRCWTGAEVERELGELDEGQGEFTVDMPLEDLLAAEVALYATGGGDDLGCAFIAPYGADVD